MAGKDIKLTGQMYLTRGGDVYMLYGGWHRMELGNVKGTKLFKRVLETHGKKEGRKTRLAAAKAISKNLSFSMG
jgi:hypothetical protein